MKPLKVTLVDKDSDGQIEVTLIAKIDNTQFGTGFVGFKTHTHDFVFITLSRLLSDGKYQRWVA